jgi:Kef-type K+ transport system membrane component KefB
MQTGCIKGLRSTLFALAVFGLTAWVSTPAKAVEVLHTDMDADGNFVLVVRTGPEEGDVTGLRLAAEEGHTVAGVEAVRVDPPAPGWHYDSTAASGTKVLTSRTPLKAGTTYSFTLVLNPDQRAPGTAEEPRLAPGTVAVDRLPAPGAEPHDGHGAEGEAETALEKDARGGALQVPAGPKGHVFHMVLVLGSLVAFAAILSVLFKFLKQSSIIAFIAVGVLAGTVGGHFHLPHDLVHTFTEIGIIMLLFMAGLEVDFKSFLKRWKLVLGTGLGQIAVTAVLGSALGFLLLEDVQGIKTIVFFGLCLTFSSTIVVISYLKNRREMESHHGQIVLGLMVLQDVTAVLALVFIKSLGGEGSLLASLGMVFVKMILLAAILVVLNLFVLKFVFRFLAKTKELLFLGSLGWALGVAAACEFFHFSPEIGAFFAGAALASLPYHLEVQDKVEPMKDFGIILFFMALGFGLKLDAGVLALVPPVLVVSLFVVFGTPLLMLFLGFLLKSNARPSFLIGGIINQISEFSLILATLCVGAGVFTEKVFLLVTLSTVATIFISSLGHEFMHILYMLFKKRLEWVHNVLDERANRGVKIKEELAGFELKDHVVVVEYNELAETVIEHFVALGKGVLLIDLNPDVYDAWKEKGKDRETYGKFRCLYADFADPDVWEETEFREAHAVFSCMIAGQQAELGILRWMRERGVEVPFVAATDSYDEAIELYENRAAYVIQTEDLASERLKELLGEFGEDTRRLAEGRDAHLALLKAKKAKAVVAV